MINNASRSEIQAQSKYYIALLTEYDLRKKKVIHQRMELIEEYMERIGRKGELDMLVEECKQQRQQEETLPVSNKPTITFPDHSGEDDEEDDDGNEGATIVSLFPSVE